MIITVAGVKKEVTEGISITKLLASEKIESPEHVTVSVNDNFIARDLFEETTLSNDDNVEFLYFMGGGSGCKITKYFCEE